MPQALRAPRRASSRQRVIVRGENAGRFIQATPPVLLRAIRKAFHGGSYVAPPGRGRPVYRPIEEVARHLGVTPHTIYWWIRHGRLDRRFIKPGRGYHNLPILLVSLRHATYAQALGETGSALTKEEHEALQAWLERGIDGLVNRMVDALTVENVA